MTLPPFKKHQYSLEEYLEFEVTSEERHQYIDGEIMLMTDDTPNHNQIIGNLYAALNFALKGKPYDVFFIDQRLWISGRHLYIYPDLMVVQEELQFKAGRRDTLTNPVMIAEVLSKATEGYDRGKKFAAYRTIPSFYEYIIIDQYSQYVEQFNKTESGQWLLSDYESENEILSLVSIPVEISLAEIYERVNFAID